MTDAISSLRILPAEIDPAAASTSSADSGFMETLRGAMGQVEQLQASADTKTAELIQGNGMDVHSAMIAVEEADLSFQLMMQVRNKIVAAYQQISSMQF